MEERANPERGRDQGKQNLDVNNHFYFVQYVENTTFPRMHSYNPEVDPKTLKNKPNK